jgi:hypothetical protein
MSPDSRKEFEHMKVGRAVRLRPPVSDNLDGPARDELGRNSYGSFPPKNGRLGGPGRTAYLFWSVIARFRSSFVVAHSELHQAGIRS